MLKTLSKLFVAAVVSLCAASSGQAVAADPQLERGITLAQEGEFEQAVSALETVAAGLAGQPARRSDLARAYLYLAVAQYGLGQEPKAKEAFGQALKADPNLRVDAGEFPPKLVRFFETTRAELAPVRATPTPMPAKTIAAATPRPAVPAVTPAPQPKKKGGSKAPLILIGVGAAAAGGAALALGGGSGSAATPGPTPTPKDCQDFPATRPPFSRIYYISEMNGAGDAIAVGQPVDLAFIRDGLKLPNRPNEIYCNPVELTPGRLFKAYVPTPQERNGDYGAFGVPLIDPETQKPYPGNIIPANRLAEVWGWRIRP